MIDYLLDYSVALFIGSIFGLIICIVGWIMETTGLTEKFAKFMYENIGEEEE